MHDPPEMAEAGKDDLTAHIVICQVGAGFVEAVSAVLVIFSDIALTRGDGNYGWMLGVETTLLSIKEMHEAVAVC